MKTVVTIAGTDPTGGAGAQADLKTFMAHEVYGMSILTALVAQNTTGVTSIMNVTPKFLKEQFDCVFTDIRPDAVKIGMVSQPELIAVIVEKLKQYAVERIVVDPVMVSTSGSRLLEGWQLRYIYFIDPECRKRLTVPEIPFSKIDEIGAGMYKGEKVTQAARHAITTPE